MANRMWGGRFGEKPVEILEEINASIDFDRALYAQDIAGSKAHVSMLAKQGIIGAEDAEKIARGLDTILSEIEGGKFKFTRALEDIHTHVEARLAELIGPAAGRLHTARSRNDQVATDTRLYVRDAIDRLDHALAGLQQALAEKAFAHAATVMPGFTHLQTAQPVTFGHHLLAYVEMLARDRSRLADARKRLNESPLGAAALAGTSFPIDRDMTAKALGFDRPAANSLDAVSDRDFALETLAAAAIAAVHLSRFAEEIVIWASPSFGLVKLSDRFTTGSSIMPQKRNPDAAELVRAKPGRIVGALVQLLVVMKGLPLAYAKDMQEDKEGLFDALSTLALMIAATEGIVRDLEPDEKRISRSPLCRTLRRRPRRCACRHGMAVPLACQAAALCGKGAWASTTRRRAARKTARPAPGLTASVARWRRNARAPGTPRNNPSTCRVMALRRVPRASSRSMYGMSASPAACGDASGLGSPNKTWSTSNSLHGS